MNSLHRKYLIIVLLTKVGMIAFGQGTFQNLDFDSAQISGYPYLVPQVLPFWQVFLGGSPATQIDYDSRALDLWQVAIHDSKSLFMQPLSGQYSLYLQGGRTGQDVRGSAEIAQFGSIDATSHSLLFSATLFGAVDVSFNGQLIPTIELQKQSGYSTYGADISAFSGQSGVLRFTTEYPNGIFLDDIRFSTQVIPEPSIIGLVGIGGGLVFLFLPKPRKY